MKRWILLIFCLPLILFSFPFSAEGAAWADIRTVKVGLINNREQRDDFAYQMLLHYLREYLDEVSKENHWQYEYFMGDLEECHHRLQSGELDFVAPIRKTERETGMIFSNGFSCYSLLCLYKYLDDSPMELTAEKMNVARIGLLDNEDDALALKHYLSDNGWKPTLQVFNTVDSMLDALHAGKLDAILSDGAHVTSKERRMVDIGTVSAQFMTTPDKAELNNALSSSIITIESLDPDFETEIEAQYLDKALQYIVDYTEEEKAFIENAPTLRVAFLPSLPPLFELGGSFEESKGNYIDILKMMSSISGLKFELVPVKSKGELHEKLDVGEVDLTFAVYTNEGSPLEMYYTGDLMREEFTLVRLDAPSTEGKGRGIAAVPVSFMGAPEFLEKRFPFAGRTYATVEECLDAVEGGKCEVAVVPSYYLQRYNSLVLRPSLKEVTGERIRIPVSMAISPAQSRVLKRVINKLALRLDRDQLAKSTLENTKPLFSVAFVLNQYPLQTAAVLCLFLALGGAGIFVWYRGNMQKRQNRVLQQKNNELRVALANVESMRIARDGYKLESEIDKLTGILNKAALERFAQERLKDMPEDRLSALYIIDLDHFKEANDTYGHQTGDVILQKFATALKRIFRTGDCIGRFGGDEFIVLVCGLPDEGVARRKAGQILQAARDIGVAGKDIRITASIGIALVTFRGKDYAAVFKEADQALYCVKENGRDGFAFSGGEVVHD